MRTVLQSHVVQAAASGGAASLETLQNLIHHWDVSNGATVTTGTGGSFNSMTDQVGSCTLTASTLNSAANFTIQTLSNGLNGVNIESLGGGDVDRLIGTAFTVVSIPTTALTVSLVAAQLNLAQFAHFDLGTTNRPILYGVTGTTIAMDNQSGVGISAAFADTDPHHFLCIFNGASSELWIDGVQVATGNTGTGATAATIAVGSVVGGNLDSRSVIGEMRVATGVPTTAQRNGEISTQMTKWGL